MEEKNEIKKEEEIIEPVENVSDVPKEKSKLVRVLIFILGIFFSRACIHAIKYSTKSALVPTSTVSSISKPQSNSTFGTYTVQDGKVIMKTLEGNVFGSFYIDSSDILREGDKGDFSSLYTFDDKYSLLSQTSKIYYPNNNILMETTVKANLSDSAVKKLMRISYSKNKMNKFLSSPEEMENFFEKEDFSMESYTMTVFYEDGNIMRTVESKNSMGNGLVKSYYKNGNLQEVIEVDNRITPNGKYEEFYENGKLAVSTTFKNGIQDGICEIYNENGKLVNKIYMKNWEALKR